MDRSLLIRIFVPTKGSDKQGACGTGYPVGPDLVLTARHVLFPADRDEDLAIQVLWHGFPTAGEDDGWYHLAKRDDTSPHDACIVWHSQELDAALLRVPSRPAGARGGGIITAEPPLTGQDLESAGFPRVAKHERGREPAGFRGHGLSMARDDAYFEIDVAVAPPREDDWRGASGMSIFRQNTQLIVGIAREIPHGWDGKRLHATPAWKLLGDPRFLAAIGHDDRQRRDRYDAVQQDLTAILEASQTALREIVRHLDPGPTADRAAPAVATRILNSDLDQIVAAFFSAYSEIISRRRGITDSERTGAIAVLEEAAQLVVPYLFEVYDLGLVTNARAHKLPGDLDFCAIPTGLPTVAEIIMAGADGRGTDFCDRADDHDYPEGRTSVAAPPEMGIGGWERQAQSLRDAIARKHTPGQWSDTRTNIDDFLFEKFVRRANKSDLDQPERVRKAAIEIRNSTSRQTYYICIRLPADTYARAEVEDGLRQLRRDYPHLVVLAYEENNALDDRYRDLFGRFARIIRKRSQSS